MGCRAGSLSSSRNSDNRDSGLKTGPPPASDSEYVTVDTTVAFSLRRGVIRSLNFNSESDGGRPPRRRPPHCN